MNRKRRNVVNYCQKNKLILRRTNLKSTIVKIVHLLLFVIVGLSGTVLASETPSVKSLTVTNPSHLLFVGNSYLYYNDSLHDHLRRMVISAGLHDRDNTKFKSATINGARLNHHDVANYLNPGQLGVDETFQVVILQGHSSAVLTEENRTQFENAVEQHTISIRNRNGEVALYMTPAYVLPHKLQRNDLIREIESLYTDMGNKVDALVIPVGLAFEESYRRRPNLQLHNEYDGSHPSLLGTYLGAATVFASLFSQSPVGNQYDIFGAVDAETRLFLQQVAHDTVKNFYQQSD